MGSLDKQPPAEETNTQPNEEGTRLSSDQWKPRAPFDLISSAGGGTTFQTPIRAEVPGEAKGPRTGEAGAILGNFGLKAAAPEAATVANADRTQYNPSERFPVSGPLTDALNKFYGPVTSTNANDLPAALTNSNHTPGELCRIFQHQPKFGWPALEGTANTLNVYDRENRQYNFSYDPQTKAYKLNDTKERGSDSYRAPERTRNNDADAFSYAAASSLQRGNRDAGTISTEVARFLNLASDRGVPLIDMVESLNRQLKSRPDGKNAAQLSDNQGVQSINIHPNGQADITVDVRQNNGKWKITSRP